MTNTALLALSGLLVLAYLLDVLGRRFRLPAVVLLIASGIVARQLMDRSGIQLSFVDLLLPVIGTIGLILIVLEGALDLEVRRERAGLIAKSSAAALLGFGATLAAFAWLFHAVIPFEWPIAVLAALPFAVISSAVAIPSAAGLPDRAREFVVYESSLSDIIGVLVFYAWLAADGSVDAFVGELAGGGALSLLAALVAAPGLFYLINRVEGHVRFLPLLAGLVLLYALGKALHLSPLILILVCGLLLNNPHLLEWNSRLRALHTPGYDKTLGEFKGIVAELTFATKSIFFLMLGYWTDTNHMTDWRAWAIAAVIVACIYASRFLILGALRIADLRRLVWLAPRGLITVLLFLTAADTGALEGFPFGVVMLVVLVTATATAFAHRGARAAAPTAESASTITRSLGTPRVPD